MKTMIILGILGIFSGFPDKPEGPAGMMQYYISGVQLIKVNPTAEEIRIEFNEFGGVKYNYAYSVMAIRCCNPTHLSHSWCNHDLDDERCQFFSL